jgi:shikimate kinase
MEESALPRSNIVLIGMPAAGKSVVGRLLAERLGRPLIDTDRVLEQRHGLPLSELLRRHGLDRFIELEEQALLALDVREAVIATGGSVIYGEQGMQALRAGGVLVFLDVPLETLERRVGDPAARGMVIEAGQSFADLYQERLPLYRRYADLTVAGEGDPQQVALAVAAAVSGGRTAARPDRS